MPNYKENMNSQERRGFWISDDFWSFRMMKMEAKPNGYEFEMILLKFYSLAAEEDGGIYIPIDKATGEMDIAHIACWLRHDTQVVKKAIKYFVEHRFLEVKEIVSADNVLEGFRFEFPDLEKRIIVEE